MNHEAGLESVSGPLCVALKCDQATRGSKKEEEGVSWQLDLLEELLELGSAGLWRGSFLQPVSIPCAQVMFQAYDRHRDRKGNELTRPFWSGAHNLMEKTGHA